MIGIRRIGGVDGLIRIDAGWDIGDMVAPDEKREEDDERECSEIHELRAFDSVHIFFCLAASKQRFCFSLFMVQL